jgi:fatty acid desaturase
VTKSEYYELRQRLAFEPRYWKSAVVLLADLALFAAALALIYSGHPAGFVAAQLIFPLVFFHMFALMHECGHGNASRRDWINVATGHIASLFCFLPFFPWRYIHTEHHAWAGVLDRDPTLKLIRDHRPEQIAKIAVLSTCWKILWPLLGLAQHFVLWGYPLQGRLRGRRLWSSLFSVLFLIGAYAGANAAWPELFSPLYFLPELVLYLIAVEWVNFPHHIGTPMLPTGKLPLWEQWRVTRTCVYPHGWSDVLVLNFNLHTEHHLFPDLLWHQLPRVRPILREALGAKYQESIGLNWNIENRRKDFVRVFFKGSFDEAARVSERT